jgi:hypothetical protein
MILYYIISITSLYERNSAFKNIIDKIIINVTLSFENNMYNKNIFFYKKDK